MRIKSKVAFSGVPKGTTGFVEKDEDLWKITWELYREKPLVDWFNEWEFNQYLEILE
jgi:hypothetical protein